jgi:hypothetical protein
MALPEIASPQESSSIGADPLRVVAGSRLAKPSRSNARRRSRRTGRDLDKGSPRKTVLRRTRQLDPMRRSDHGELPLAPP